MQILALTVVVVIAGSLRVDYHDVMNDSSSHSNPPASRESLSWQTPLHGRLLGVDYGTRRVGLAISTLDQKIASPLSTYERCQEQQDRRYFRTLMEEYQVRGIVLGLPIHVNGAEGSKAWESRQYGKWLAQLTGLPIDFWDERFTSAVAEDFMLAANLTRQQRKKRVDKIAAQIILQSFLDRRQAVRHRENQDEEPTSEIPPDFGEDISF